MQLLTKTHLMILLVSLPLAAHAEYVRCTSPDGKSSTIQRGKCASPTDIQAPVNIVKPLPKSPAASGEFEEGLGAYKAQDYAKALKLFGPLAEQGHPMAQILLGDMYHHGKGVIKNDSTAYTWTRKAAGQGNAHAEAALGVMHQEGWGTPKDEAQAVAWFRKSADQGYATAQAKLGFMYSNGQGVAKDEAQALVWFRKAAEGGNADAQTLLGLAYHEGHGVPKDDGQAKLWLQKAASQGNANAKAALPQLGR